MAKRNISVWSVDVISGDTDPGATSAKITKDTLSRIRQLGKGIILFHDIKRPTAEALDGILTELEHDGYKFVQVVSNTYYQPDPELMAKADIFKAGPETKAMTGQWAASAKEQLKDGSVDVMHTEWIDLKGASEQPANQENEGVQTQASSEAQQPSSYSANSWAVNGSMR